MSTNTDVIAVDEVERWHDHTDVLVVGFGAAGASAAIEARDAGAAVQIIERASGPGGTSAVAGGHFYLGGGTPVQLACGFPDTADDMFRYLAAVTPEPDVARHRASPSTARTTPTSTSSNPDVTA